MSDESSISDGYEINPAEPTTGPRAGVWLSARDPVARDLLLEYARRLREADPEFSRDLEAALDSAGSAVGSGALIAAAPDEAGPRQTGGRSIADAGGVYISHSMILPGRDLGLGPDPAGGHRGGDGDPHGDGDPVSSCAITSRAGPGGWIISDVVDPSSSSGAPGRPADLGRSGPQISDRAAEAGHRAARWIMNDIFGHASSSGGLADEHDGPHGRFDRDLSAELIAQAREDDGRMVGGEWRAVGFGAILEIESSLTHQDGANIGVAEDIRRDDALGICRTRNDLRRVADQLEAAVAESSRLDGALRESAGSLSSARAEVAGLRRHLRRDRRDLRLADLELEVSLESLSWATSALAHLTREVVGYDAAKEQAARISAGLPSVDGEEAVPLSRRDLDTMEYAARIDEKFGAGIFPRGAGQHAHFRRLVRLGMIALDSHGRDMNGEVEHDVTIYRLTSEGRKIVQDAVVAVKE